MFTKGSLLGIIEDYVDENLNSGKEHFQKSTDKTLEDFESKLPFYDSLISFSNEILTRGKQICLLNNEATSPRRLGFKLTARVRNSDVKNRFYPGPDINVSSMLAS